MPVVQVATFQAFRFKRAACQLCHQNLTFIDNLFGYHYYSQPLNEPSFKETAILWPQTSTGAATQRPGRSFPMSSIALEPSEIVRKTMAVVSREKAIPTRATTNFPGLCTHGLVPFPS
ncbi:hypothetical protein FALCPG4_000861 [Fusarium falciforme]